MIAVAQDPEGLRMAALELLEESLNAAERARNERFAEIAVNSEAMLRMPDARTLSPGYYMWLGYVMEEIAQPLEAGIAFHHADLTAEEVMTLAIIGEARMKFQRLHPPCNGCGKPLADAAFGRTCGDCKSEAAAAGRER